MFPSKYPSNNSLTKNKNKRHPLHFHRKRSEIRCRLLNSNHIGHRLKLCIPSESFIKFTDQILLCGKLENYCNVLGNCEEITFSVLATRNASIKVKSGQSHLFFCIISEIKYICIKMYICVYIML